LIQNPTPIQSIYLKKHWNPRQSDRVMSRKNTQNIFNKKKDVMQSDSGTSKKKSTLHSGRNKLSKNYIIPNRIQKRTSSSGRIKLCIRSLHRTEHEIFYPY
jgi:hypothetical protein